MKKYISFFKCAVQETMIYRWNFFFGILSKFAVTIVMFYIWRIMFKSNQIIAGYTWESMKVYLFVSFLCTSTISWNAEMSMSKKVIQGNIIADLIKPVNLRTVTLVQAIGNSFFSNLCAIGIMFYFAIFIFKVSLPTDFQIWISFLISIGLSFLLNFILSYIFSLFSFWTSNAYGIATARSTISNFFSGALVPLELFPPLLARIAFLLPFKGIVYIPTSIFIGTLSGSEIYHALMGQTIWLMVLWGISSLLWKQAVKQVTINGG